MKIIAYLSTLNKQELNEFSFSTYNLAIARTFDELAGKLNAEQLELLKKSLDEFNFENNKKEELLSLIKQPDTLQKTVDKIFNEHFKSLEAILPGFNRVFVDQLQKVFVELDELVEV